MFALACNIHALCYLLYAKHVANMCRTVTQVTLTRVIIIIICMVAMYVARLANAILCVFYPVAITQ